MGTTLPSRLAPCHLPSRGGCFQRHHRFPGNFFNICILLSEDNKKVLVPLREQGQKIQFLRYHLACRFPRPLTPMPTHRLPHNAGKASKDTQAQPFPSALGGPFAAPLFAPLSAMRNSLWMRLQFYFRLNGFIIKLCSLYTICAGLSSVIFRQTKTNVPGIKTLFVWEGFNPPLHCRVKPMEPANSDVILSGMKWS